MFWVGCLIFFLLTFGATTVDTIQIGSRGNVNVNAPFAIVQTLAIMSVFAVFVVVAMVAGTVIRDDETGFAPILRSTRLGKGSYLGGRFMGSIAAALLVLATIPLAIAIGAAMPWQDAEKVGPFVAGHYFYALFVFGLPTLLITGAAFFALATATRSLMWTYVGAVAMLVLFSVTRVWLRDMQHDTFAALSDPFGLSALAIGTKYWTAAERNTLLPAAVGPAAGQPRVVDRHRSRIVRPGLAHLPLRDPCRQRRRQAQRRRNHARSAQRPAAGAARRRRHGTGPALGPGPLRHGLSSFAARRSSCCCSSA